MSHISEITNVRLADIDLLAVACKELGLELVKNQKTYHTGLTELPCDHVIRLAGTDGLAELGVIREGEAYKIVSDYGFLSEDLQVKLGNSAERLRQAYSVATSLQETARDGFSVMNRTVLADGTMVLRVSR